VRLPSSRSAPWELPPDAFRRRRWEFRKETAAATDRNAAITFDPFVLGANQRAHAVGPVADGIQRIETCQLDIELGVSLLVEEVERLPGAIVPIAVDVPRIAADPFSNGPAAAA